MARLPKAGLREVQRDIDESKALSVDQFAARKNHLGKVMDFLWDFTRENGDLTRENGD